MIEGVFLLTLFLYRFVTSILELENNEKNSLIFASVSICLPDLSPLCVTNTHYLWSPFFLEWA